MQFPGQYQPVALGEAANLQTLQVGTKHDDVSVLAYGADRYVPRSPSLGNTGEVANAPFARLEWLEISPMDQDALLAASKALELHKSSGLEVDCSRYTGSLAYRENTTRVVHDPITEVLFNRHKLCLPDRQLRAKWQGLTRLLLQNVDLRFCRQTWFRHLYLSKLETLGLEFCEHADLFLFELNRDLPPKLKGFYIVHDLGAAHPDRTVVAFDIF